MPVIPEDSLLRMLLTSEPGTDAPVPAVPEDPGRIRPLEEVLRQRRSVRTFGADEVSQSDIGFIIRSGLAAERSLWTPGTHRGMDVTIATAAFGVGELGQGLYLPAAEAGTLFARVPGQEWLTGLQAQYAAAPALLLVCGNVPQACAATGVRGYPQLLVRAGSAGYGAWLAAVSIGLAGCAFGGSNYRVTSAVARHCGEPLRHLFTIAIGHPGSRSPSDEDARDH
jgi:nitroreductase